MHFFKQFFNMDHVERIQWGLEFSHRELIRDNVEHCRVFFCSGHERDLMRDEARELFDYLESQVQTSEDFFISREIQNAMKKIYESGVVSGYGSGYQACLNDHQAQASKGEA